MREIKFRAWDTKDNFMDDDLFIGYDGSIFSCAKDVYNTPHQEIEHVNHLIIMQYTGLEDKNGKEIYENDILSHKSYFIGDVPFDADNGVVMFDDGMYYLGEEYQIELDSSAIFNYDIEIIGNIHEDKNLLK